MAQTMGPAKKSKKQGLEESKDDGQINSSSKRDPFGETFNNPEFGEKNVNYEDCFDDDKPYQP